MTTDPFAAMKANAKEGWATFGPNAMFTTEPAFVLVDYAGIRAGQKVLDVGCGTGVVACTAAMRGAQVTGLDLSPVLLEEAKFNAAVGGLAIEFVEGDCERLPFADASFDVVVSQFGHMFAPRPGVATAEMLRVLKPGGRIAFATWPPHLVMGRMFDLFAECAPPPAGAALPSSWGTVEAVWQRLGDRVVELEFASGEMRTPALSPKHFRARMEQNSPPLKKAIAGLGGDAAAMERLRGRLEGIVAGFFRGNVVVQAYLMARASKR